MLKLVTELEHLDTFSMPVIDALKDVNDAEAPTLKEGSLVAVDTDGNLGLAETASSPGAYSVAAAGHAAGSNCYVVFRGNKAVDFGLPGGDVGLGKIVVITGPSGAQVETSEFSGTITAGMALTAGAGTDAGKFVEAGAGDPVVATAQFIVPGATAMLRVKLV